MTSNGDDHFQLQLLDGTVIDYFGNIGASGDGTSHEFEDGRAERNACSVTEPSATYVETEWFVDNDKGGATAGLGPRNPRTSTRAAGVHRPHQ